VREIFEFRIPSLLANKYLKELHYVQVDRSVAIVKTEKNSDLYQKIIDLQNLFYGKGESFFFGWDIKRKYSREEIQKAEFFYLKIKKTINSCGEDCGTVYNDNQSCKICGAGGIQNSDLILDKRKIPNSSKVNAWKTIAGEIGISSQLATLLVDSGCSPQIFGIIRENNGDRKKINNWVQLKKTKPLYRISQQTVSGVNPFNLTNGTKVLSEDFLNLIKPLSSIQDINQDYACPLGHTIGLNLLSEIYLKISPTASKPGLLSWTEQCLGVRRGLLRPEHCLIINKELFNILLSNKMTGFSFEIAHCVSE